MAYQLLVMDDSVTIRRVVELTFAGGDVQVVGVGDGRAALDRIEADPPDVILADVGTTQPDGYEVSAHVKGTPALAHIPVLLLSGAFQPIDEERAMASRCDGVLAKPFDPEAVATRVRQLLGGAASGQSPTRGEPPSPEGWATPDERGSHPEPASVPAPPAAPPDTDDLVAFFERLLAEAPPGDGDSPGRAPDARVSRWEGATVLAPATSAEMTEITQWGRASEQWGRASVPALIQPPLPSPAGNGSFSLDEYFDLIDEVLGSR